MTNEHRRRIQRGFFGGIILSHAFNQRQFPVGGDCFNARTAITTSGFMVVSGFTVINVRSEISGKECTESGAVTLGIVCVTSADV